MGKRIYRVTLKYLAAPEVTVYKYGHKKQIEADMEFVCSVNTVVKVEALKWWQWK